MNQTDRIKYYIDEGISPAKIAAQCQITTSDVAQVISAEVEGGHLTPSKVLSIFDNDWRVTVEGVASICGNSDNVIEAIKMWDMAYDIEEVKIYFEYKDKEKQISAGKLYEMISDTERELHAVVKTALVQKYGATEAGWWGQGVPEKVRFDCVRSREGLCEFEEDPYSFTTFIHLAEIIKDNWDLFASRLPRNRANDKPKLLADLRRMNSIRNQIMHPVRGKMPNEDDFNFIQNLQCEVRQFFKTNT